MSQQEHKDFFISYRRRDREWAQWIAETLRAHGETVVDMENDFDAGSNFHS